MSTENTTSGSMPESNDDAGRVRTRRRFVRLGKWVLLALPTAALAVYAVDWVRDAADRAQ